MADGLVTSDRMGQSKRGLTMGVRFPFHRAICSAVNLRTLAAHDCHPVSGEMYVFRDQHGRLLVEQVLPVWRPFAQIVVPRPDLTLITH